MAAFRIFNGFRHLTLSNKNFKIATTCYQQQIFLSTKTEKPSGIASDSATEKKKKSIPIPKVTLISPDESIHVVSVEEAQKISKRRDLKLVKIVDLDTKTQRPIYKLMTGSEYHAEDLKQRELKKDKSKSENVVKGEKLLFINSRITDHDLESRIKNILKWITKKYEVRVVIGGDSSNIETSEKVYNAIEQSVKAEGRLVQKRTKGNELKFQILPPKVIKTKPNSESENAL